MSKEANTALGPMSQDSPVATSNSVSDPASSTTTTSGSFVPNRVPRGSTSSAASAGLAVSTTSSSSTTLNKVPLGLLRKAYRRLTSNSDHHHPHAHIHSRAPPQSQPQAQADAKLLISPTDASNVLESSAQSPVQQHLLLVSGSASSKDSRIFERSASTGNIYGSGTCICQDLEHGEEVLVSSEGIPTHLNGEDFTIPTLDLTTELVTDPHVSFELIKLKLCDRKRSRSFISSSLMSSLDGDSLKEMDGEANEEEDEDEVEESVGYLEDNDVDDATTKNSAASVRSAPYVMLAMDPVTEDAKSEAEASERREKIAELPRSQTTPNGDYVVLDYYSFNELVHHRPKYVNKSRDYILDPTSQPSS